MGLDIDLNLAAEDDDNYNKDGRGEEYGDSNGNESSINTKKHSEPYVGMEFDSDLFAYSFYLEYGKITGFAASMIVCRRSKATLEWVEGKFSCTRYGTKRKTDARNPRPCMKIDYKAMLHIKRSRKGAPKRIKSGVEISSRKYNKKPKQAQENLGLSKNRTTNSLHKIQEKPGDESYENTEECLQDTGNMLD